MSACAGTPSSVAKPASDEKRIAMDGYRHTEQELQTWYGDHHRSNWKDSLVTSLDDTHSAAKPGERSLDDTHSAAKPGETSLSAVVTEQGIPPPPPPSTNAAAPQLPPATHAVRLDSIKQVRAQILQPLSTAVEG